MTTNDEVEKIDEIDEIEEIEEAEGPKPFEVKGLLRRQQAVASGLAASLLLLAAFCHFALPAGLRLQGAIADTVTWPLLGVALILILLSSRLRSRILKEGVAVSRFHPDRAPAVLTGAYRRASVASLAVLEGAALLGLVLSLVTGSPRYGAVFGLLCFLAMLTRWPRERELSRLIDGRLRL